jgi:hypothetical protein
MACQQYLNAIHELVDGTLGPLRRAELELHLETCDGCRALAGDLLEIARASRSLEPLAPPARVWARVADRLQQEGRVTLVVRTGTRQRSYAVLALAAALVLAVGASLYLLRPRPASPAAPEQTAATAAPDTPGNVEPVDPVQGVDSELALTEQHFQRAVDQATKAEGTVDPQTAAVLQKTLLTVNEAIAESRAALKSEPGSTTARQSLYEALKQKIQFLQDTIALMNEMRQGDAAGAAEIVEGGKKS